MKKSHKPFLFWTISLALALGFFQFYEYKNKTRIKDFNYPKFLQALEGNQVVKDSIVFNLSTKQIKGNLNDKGSEKFGGTDFIIEGNVEDKGFEILRDKGITPAYLNKDNSIWTSLLISWFPLIIIFGLFFFFIKQFQAGGNKAFSFGKSKARLVVEKGKVTFKDVAGIEEAKEEVKELVEFLKKPSKFTKLGGEIPKGVLLIGPPGTGKTLLARAVAGEAKVPFFTISGSDFVEMFVGVGASRVRDLFKQGKRNAPCLIFIDEIDAVGRHRGAGLGGGHDEREQTLNQLLVEMDGFQANSGIIIIAATNRSDVLDPALLRPGRFDRRVIVHLPDLKGREKILEVHTKKTPLSSDVKLSEIARGTPGFSGADLKNLINEGSLMAAFKNKVQIEMEDLERARDKVIMGSERKSFIMGDKDKEITAYHESGHALIGKSLPLLDPVHKVTIIPRGMALGVTQTLPKEDLLNMSKQRAKNTLAFLFGGRIAEELIFKDFTSGASNDIERATELARRMVCEWGMSDKIGPLSLGKRSDHVFVGMNQQTDSECSEERAKERDSEIKKFIAEAYKQGTEVISKNLNILHEMSKALLQFETIHSDEIDLLIKGKKIADLKKHREDKQSKLQDERDKKKSKKDSKNEPMGSPAPALV